MPTVTSQRLRVYTCLFPGEDFRFSFSQLEDSFLFNDFMTEIQSFLVRKL
jgi:hypothetical protein